MGLGARGYGVRHHAFKAERECVCVREREGEGERERQNTVSSTAMEEGSAYITM